MTKTMMAITTTVMITAPNTKPVLKATVTPSTYKFNNNYVCAKYNTTSNVTRDSIYDLLALLNQSFKNIITSSPLLCGY